jgi:manganese/iron transport system substrate-binding protein
MKMNFNFNLQSQLSAILALCAGLLFAAGCAQSANPNPQGMEKLRVVATTTLVADVVRNIGGDRIQLDTLLPVGADPHSFQPTPQELARLAQADVIFVNGGGLEEYLLPLIKGANPTARQVDVSEGIALLGPPAGDTGEKQLAGDPHVWTDPNLVMVWAQNIARALGELDPGDAGTFQANAATYTQALRDLDAWVRQQTATIPPENRRLVTDHQDQGYFARAYGFEQVGAILPGFSSVTEATAQELAALEDAIRAQGVKAILVGTTINPTLAKQVAGDTGTRLVPIYTGSLSEPGGPASTYLDYMRYNVTSIVEALK